LQTTVNSNVLGVLTERVCSRCQPRTEAQAVKHLRRCFYCTVNHLLIHLTTFVGDVLFAYFLQKTACMQ